MSVWFAIPTCRPKAEAEQHISKWRDLGYKLAFLRQGEPLDADVCVPVEKYLGWPRSVNLLAQYILARDPNADWIVTGGDDYEPVMDRKPAEIAAECEAHFNGRFGVMQPTGDRWQEVHGEALIDRIAGSPWIGREWCERAYQGQGPLCSLYYHLHADEELQEVAKRLGVFWQRRDLTQKHCHWGRKDRPTRADIPEFLQYINSSDHWHESTMLFQDRKRKGFPGSEPLA